MQVSVDTRIIGTTNTHLTRAGRHRRGLSWRAPVCHTTVGVDVSSERTSVMPLTRLIRQV